MRKVLAMILVGLAIGLLMFGMVGVASANILTFDDVSGPDVEPGVKVVPNGYGGFNWSWMYAMDPGAPGSYGTDNGYGRGRVSGDWVAFNAYDYMTTTSTTGTFDFTGAYFTSAWDQTNIIEAFGYENGVQKYTISLDINDQTPTWLSFNWHDIDTLTLSSTGWHFAMDNFTYNENSSVPEPSTLLLFGAGLAGAAIYRKRMKRG